MLPNIYLAGHGLCSMDTAPLKPALTSFLAALRGALDAMQCAIYGNFSAPKAQEIVVSRGCYLELLRPDDNGKVQTILSSNVFGVIRALAPFRLTGGLKDYIIIGSDSGRIVILEYSKEKHAFVKLHQVRSGFSPIA